MVQTSRIFLRAGTVAFLAALMFSGWRLASAAEADGEAAGDFVPDGPRFSLADGRLASGETWQLSGIEDEDCLVLEIAADSSGEIVACGFASGDRSQLEVIRFTNLQDDIDVVFGRASLDVAAVRLVGMASDSVVPTVASDGLSVFVVELPVKPQETGVLSALDASGSVVATETISSVLGE